MALVCDGSGGLCLLQISHASRLTLCRFLHQPLWSKLGQCCHCLPTRILTLCAYYVRCMKAGLKKSALEHAQTLMRPEHRSLISETCASQSTGGCSSICARRVHWRDATRTNSFACHLVVLCCAAPSQTNARSKAWFVKARRQPTRRTIQMRSAFCNPT